MISRRDITNWQRLAIIILFGLEKARYSLVLHILPIYNTSTRLLGLLFTDDYKITRGDYYNLEANYSNNGMYTYITDYDVNFTKSTLVVADDYFVTSDYDRADFPTIIVAQFIIVLILYFVINKLTRLVFKGGL